MRICTIVARNYLAYARVLAGSFLAQHPAGECVVLLIDDVAREVDDADEPFRVIRPAELQLDRFEAMAGMYDVTELATAVKPWLLEHLLEIDGSSPITYFDPDIRFFAPIDEIERTAIASKLVLIPHITTPIPDDGKQPGELDLMASGTYNLGFISMAPSAQTSELLRWWQSRLRYDCVIDHALGFFVDQRWFDLVPNTFADTAVLRHPGMNVAYWNLHERFLSRDEEGRWLVNGQPLLFFHFSGFDPERPHLLSKHQTRTLLSETPEVAALCREFAAEVHEHKRRADKVPYAWAKLGDGRPWSRRLRRLYRQGERDEAFRLSPFEPAGASEFYDWLSEPAPEVGPATPINRYWFDLYQERTDLQVVFPDLTRDPGGYMQWIEAERHQYADADGLYRASGVRVARRPEEADPEADEEYLGVNVAGFLQSELGIGEAARGLIEALDAARVSVLPVHGAWRPSSRQEHAYTMFDTAGAAFPINIVCVNADVLPAWAEHAGSDFFAGRYTIGFWWWEVLAFPTEWLPAFDLVDEVWVASQHVADALMPVSSVPVTRVTMPVTATAYTSARRASLNLPDGFLFLFLFDHHSIFERKNPLGAIEAFKRAFNPGSGASLVIKCINHEHHRDAHERLLAAASDHPDVHILDRYVSAAEKNAMIASADCYVSLHRAEGFGLTMAEAMCLGKPVIATRYGGNLEFMNDRNSWLVDATMIPIGQGHAPYPARGEWADADLDQAASHMREVFDGSPEVRVRAERGAAHMAAEHSPAAAARTMRLRLEHINARRSLWPRRSQSVSPYSSIARVEELLASGPVPPRRSPLGPIGRFVRRVVLRLIKPFTAYQDMINRELSTTVRSLTDQQRRVQAGRVRASRETAAELAELRRHARALDRLASSVSGLEADVEGLGQTKPPPRELEPESSADPEAPRFARRLR